MLLSSLNRSIRSPTTRAAAASRLFASVATVAKDKVPVADQDRVLVEDAQSGDPILVAKLGDSFYAIEATCPHMNKSMENGKILTDRGPDPEIRCRFHNSRFNMKTGVCTKWVTGALGFDNKLVSGVVQNLGGEKRDLTAYRVIQNEDCTLTIDNSVGGESA